MTCYRNYTTPKHYLLKACQRIIRIVRVIMSERVKKVLYIHHFCKPTNPPAQVEYQDQARQAWALALTASQDLARASWQHYLIRHNTQGVIGDKEKCGCCL